MHDSLGDICSLGLYGPRVLLEATGVRAGISIWPYALDCTRLLSRTPPAVCLAAGLRAQQVLALSVARSFPLGVVVRRGFACTVQRSPCCGLVGLRLYACSLGPGPRGRRVFRTSPSVSSPSAWPARTASAPAALVASVSFAFFGGGYRRGCVAFATCAPGRHGPSAA